MQFVSLRDDQEYLNEIQLFLPRASARTAGNYLSSG